LPAYNAGLSDASALLPLGGICAFDCCTYLTHVCWFWNRWI